MTQNSVRCNMIYATNFQVCDPNFLEIMLNNSNKVSALEFNKNIEMIHKTIKFMSKRKRDLKFVKEMMMLLELQIQNPKLLKEQKSKIKNIISASRFEISVK
jgi:hypothetical protein